MADRLTKGSWGMLALLGALLVASPARAGELTFAALSSRPGIPSLLLDLATSGVGSLDLPTPFDPADPFFTAAVVDYTQTLPAAGTFPGVFKMASIAVDAPVSLTETRYGAGSFSIGLITPDFALPWVTAAFSNAFLAYAPDLSTATFFNLGGTTFTGLGAEISGLRGPGSFALGLGNPFVYTDQSGAPTGVGFEITSSVLKAVPEPASLLLCAVAAAGYAARRHRHATRARACVPVATRATEQPGGAPRGVCDRRGFVYGDSGR